MAVLLRKLCKSIYLCYFVPSVKWLNNDISLLIKKGFNFAIKLTRTLTFCIMLKLRWQCYFAHCAILHKCAIRTFCKETHLDSNGLFCAMVEKKLDSNGLFCAMVEKNLYPTYLKVHFSIICSVQNYIYFKSSYEWNVILLLFRVMCQMT